MSRSEGAPCTPISKEALLDFSPTSPFPKLDIKSSPWSCWKRRTGINNLIFWTYITVNKVSDIDELSNSIRFLWLLFFLAMWSSGSEATKTWICCFQNPSFFVTAEARGYIMMWSKVEGGYFVCCISDHIKSPWCRAGSFRDSYSPISWSYLPSPRLNKYRKKSLRMSSYLVTGDSHTKA